MDIRKTYTLEIGRPVVYDLVLAGCGGTGSFLALHLSRLAYHARQRHGLDICLALVDPDVVEAKNIGRQNFCPAELGQPKARALMERYNRAFGLDWEAHVEVFDSQHINNYASRFHLVIGCVDNGAGRLQLHQAVARARGDLWWLDCGNHEHAGQVLLGNRVDLRAPKISPLGFCEALPAPSVQHPELLNPPPALEVEVPALPTPSLRDGASCAELALADAQSLMINQAVAGWAASYLARLILTHDLDTLATYVDLRTGSARSVTITSQGEE